MLPGDFISARSSGRATFHCSCFLAVTVPEPAVRGPSTQAPALSFHRANEFGDVRRRGVNSANWSRSPVSAWKKWTRLLPEDTLTVVPASLLRASFASATIRSPEADRSPPPRGAPGEHRQRPAALLATSGLQVEYRPEADNVDAVALHCVVWGREPVCPGISRPGQL